MAYLNKEELEFLIELENELGKEENWTPRVEKLWKLIERHQTEDKKTNEKTWKLIKQKRLIDKTYGRSRKMKDNIIKFKYVNGWGEETTAYTTEKHFNDVNDDGEIYITDNINDIEDGKINNGWEIYKETIIKIFEKE